MLSYILTEFAKEVGQPLNTAIDRANAISKINKAARELYAITDLVGSLREQVFDVDASKLQITLPYYVDKIRGARHYDTKNRIKIEDMRPRYFYGREWPQKHLTWRKKNTSYIAHEITNEAPLTISIPQAEDSRFKVIIVGSTSKSDRVVESVTFEIGDTTKTLTNNFNTFPGFQFIGKDKIITQNVKIEDESGITIAEIANCEFESRYTIIAISDYEQSVGCNCYEFLYKYKFSPFHNDYDTFPAPNYDDAIVCKAVSQFYSKDTSENGIGQAKALEWEARCSAILKQNAEDGEGSDEKEIQFGRNRFFDIQGNGYPTGFTADIPTRVL